MLRSIYHPNCLKFLPAILCCAFIATACSEPPPTDALPEEAKPLPRQYGTRGGAMINEAGEVLTLRGMNLSGVAKRTDDHLFDLQPEDIAKLQAGGMNSIRLLTFWNAITPDEAGKVDTAYVDAFITRVQMLTDADFYVVIDMHQDLWGAPFVPHGAPTWACPEDIQAGYVGTSPWWANYSSEQVSGCFDNFWDSPDLQQAFVDAWVAIATAVCPFDKVVGFDLFNEPFPGFEHFTMDFDNRVVMPFYQAIMEEIEAVCPSKLYFLEPSAGFALGLANPLEIPPEIKDRSVFAGHFYPAEVHEPDGGGYNGDAADLEAYLLTKISHSLDNEVPIWIGEYGGYTDSPQFDRYISDLHTLFRKYNVSSAWWDYYKNDSGFAYLDAEGIPKPIFDAVFHTPVATLAPDVPTVTPNYDERSATIAFDCHLDRNIEVVLSNAECQCTEPSGQKLEEQSDADRLFRATCISDGATTVTCQCPMPTETCEPSAP